MLKIDSIKGKGKDKKKTKKIRAYIIIYSSEKKEMLVAQKQVISYETIKVFKHPESKKWQNIKQGIIGKKPNLLKKQGGTRLYGLLMPAGGKEAFFGGGGSNMQAKKTAVRELYEEILTPCNKVTLTRLAGLNEQDRNDPEAKIKIIQYLENQICRHLVIVQKTDWGGVYYKLELESLQDKTLADFFYNLSSCNGELYARAEILASNLSLCREESESDFLPEMRRFDWLPINVVPPLLEEIDEIFIKTEVTLFCNFFCKELQCNSDPTIMEFFINQVIEYMKNEPVDSNIKAISLLSESLEKRELIIEASSASQETEIEDEMNSVVQTALYPKESSLQLPFFNFDAQVVIKESASNEVASPSRKEAAIP